MDIKIQHLNELMMAQQPIFDRQSKLFGYELLFRGSSEQHANVDNAEQATSQVLVNLCIGISEIEAQSRQPFFINMSTDLVLSDAFFPIDPDTVFIEILEDQTITEEFVTAVKRWHGAGFRFVLDDYQFTDSYAPLLPYVSMIKVDVLETHPNEVSEKLKSFRQQGIGLIAEKIENKEMFDLCMAHGFSYFQGYYLQRPEVIRGKQVNADVQGALKLLNMLQSEQATLQSIAQQVGLNPTLSYQVLRLMNSPVVGLNKKVESIKEAVVFLGIAQLRRWSMLITLSSQKTSNQELLRMLLIRARCCELLAMQSKVACPDKAFTVGLLSGLDRVLQINQHELMSQITLVEDSKEAILQFKGPLGRILYSATSIECEEWERAARIPYKVRGSLNQAFFDSLQWANQITAALK